VIYGLAALVLAIALASWLFLVGEGSYLGARAVKALYEWGASRYDQVKEVLPQEDALHLARPLLARLQGRTAPMVLDIATGTGRLPMALLRQWDFDGRLVGLDLSPRMLAIAQNKTQTQRQRMGLIQANALTLCFRDGAFDAVTCLEALELVAHLDIALTEIMRVLRPGGEVLLSNRVGLQARLLPGRTHRPQAFEKRLSRLGLMQVQTRRWQADYDLVAARKPMT
jgi:ubiquinone/menaquinone biosynthesis C-methylase UbiE